MDRCNTKNSNIQRIALRKGDIIHIPNFFNKNQSDYYFNLFLESINWKQETINMYGKKLPFSQIDRMVWR